MAVILTLVHRVREDWSSNLEPAKSYTGYEQFATAPIFCESSSVALVFCCGDGPSETLYTLRVIWRV